MEKRKNEKKKPLIERISKINIIRRDMGFVMGPLHRPIDKGNLDANKQTYQMDDTLVIFRNVAITILNYLLEKDFFPTIIHK